MTDESNYVQFAYVRGDWSATIRGEGPEDLQFRVDSVFGTGAYEAIAKQIGDKVGSAAIDRGVTLLADGGVTSGGVTPTSTPDTTPSFVPSGTPQATFGGQSGGGGAKKGPINLGVKDGHEVVLWPEGQYGASVVLKGFNGPNGKELRANLAKGEDPYTLTLDRAVQLLASKLQYLQTKV